MSKEYQCPHCHVVSEDWEWNDTTKAEFGVDILPVPNEAIDNHLYVCPFCGEHIDGHDIIERTFGI